MSETPAMAAMDKHSDQEQIAALEAHDIDGLMAQYHDDAVLISFDFTIKGSQALRAAFRRRIWPAWAA